MLRTSILLTVSALAFAGTAAAQQPPTPQAAPQEAPPKSEPIEKREAEVLPERPVEPRTKIRERKQGGEVQEATVTSSGSTYTLRPENKRSGNAQTGSVDAGPSRAPTWTVLDFNFGKKKDKAEEGAAEGQAGQADAPPPPPKSVPAKK